MKKFLFFIGYIVCFVALTVCALYFLDFDAPDNTVKGLINMLGGY